jgi:TonB family protein
MTMISMPNGTRAAGRLAALAFTFAALAAASPVGAQSATPAPDPKDPHVVWTFDQVTEQARFTNAQTFARTVSERYPRRMLDLGVAGSAVLQVIVSPNGTVEHVDVVDATHHEFAAVAYDAARAMRFKPAKVMGVPVRSRFTVPVDFRPADS